MRIVTESETLHDRTGHLGGVHGALERQRRLLQGEAVNVRVDERISMSGRREREPAGAQRPEHCVMVAQGRRAWIGPRLQQRQRPGMQGERRPR